MCLSWIPAALLAAADPATPQEAARVLDLRTFGRMQGAVESSMNTLGMLMYEAPAPATAAFEFQRAQLTKTGWKELPGGYHDTNNHSAQFAKNDYTLSVSTTSVTRESDKQGWSRVSLINHGNVPAAKLPVPEDARGCRSRVQQGHQDDYGDECR
jgi:hypothetical protein